MNGEEKKQARKLIEIARAQALGNGIDDEAAMAVMALEANADNVVAAAATNDDVLTNLMQREYNEALRTLIKMVHSKINARLETLDNSDEESAVVLLAVRASLNKLMNALDGDDRALIDEVLKEYNKVIETLGNIV
jgi:hypothetical protein